MWLLKNKINKNIMPIFVFLFFFAIFLVIQSSSLTLIDIDGYYHVKHSLLYQKEGLYQSFDWLQFSILKDSFSDLWFLYHIILEPFVFIEPFIGIKIITALFATLFFLIFYLILKRFANSAFFWTIILFSISSIFIFRIDMARPIGLSLLFLFLGIYFLWQRKYLFLFITSLLYTLSYELSFLLPFFCFITYITNYFSIKKTDFKSLAASFGGLLTGYLIHPDSLNLIYLISQTIKILPLKMSGLDLGIGAEMGPISDYLNFLKENLFLIVLFFIGFILFFIKILEIKIKKEDFIIERKYNLQSFQLTSLITSLIFLILTLNAQRFIEYWVPFTVLFAALTIGEFLSQEKASQMVKKILLKIYETPERLQANKSILKIYAWGFGAIILSYAMFANTYLNIAWQKQNPSAERFKKASQWLIANTPKDSIVFNTSWGDFPLLFFNNTHNYYIVGMDPTFMYAYNKPLYWKWRHITDEGMVKSTETGSPLKSQSVYDSIKNDFGSNYIFIDRARYYYQLKKVLEQDERFKKVYEDKETEIWELL